MVKKLLELLLKRIPKINQKEYRIEKVIIYQVVSYIIYQIVSYMSSGKTMIAGLIKRTLYKICHYFPNHIIALVKLKTEVDKIDVDNLKNAPVDLSKLSGAVNNKVEKKCI